MAPILQFIWFSYEQQAVSVNECHAMTCDFPLAWSLLGMLRQSDKMSWLFLAVYGFMVYDLKRPNISLSYDVFLTSL